MIMSSARATYQAAAGRSADAKAAFAFAADQLIVFIEQACFIAGHWLAGAAGTNFIAAR
jgi:hypothetical protein